MYTIERRNRRGTTSVMKSAIPMLTGTAKNSAIAETSSVPAMNASAPKCWPGTSHVFDVKKCTPSFENAGHASCVVENAMRPSTTSTENPARSAIHRNARSANRPGGRWPSERWATGGESATIRWWRTGR